MVNPQVVQYARQDADDGRSARRSRQPSVAVAAMTQIDHRPEHQEYAGRSERNPATTVRQGRHRPRTYQAPRSPADPIIVTLLVGLVTEAVLPWAAIWISDVFVFDIPIWSLWVVFSVPPVLTGLVVLIQSSRRSRF
jgi:hypothetical protein